MTSEMQAYLDAVEQCLEQCAIMRDLEAEKRDALLHSDPQRLERIIAQEQADMMRLGSLENDRLALQAAAGFAGMTGEQMLSALPEGEEKYKAEPLIRELQATVAELQKLNQHALELAKQQMLIFGSADMVQPAGSESPTYRPGQPKSHEWTPRRSFEEKI